MARPPTPVIRGTAQLNPVASPVDAFVAPGRSRLRDFAESLSQFHRPLREFIDQRAEQQVKDDAIRGEAAFYADNADGMAEGVRSGQIPPQYSPAFVKGWKRAQGNVAGGTLREKFAQEYDAWEGKNDEDPAAFDKFYQDFLKRNLDANSDPEVLAGLLPSVREIEANGRSRHIEYRAKQTYDGHLEAGIAGASQDIDAGNDAGLASEQGTDYPAVFTNIMERRKSFVSTGGSPDDFDKKMVDAISLKVIEKRDPGLLKFFDQKVPGEEYTYGDTAYGSKVKQATIENLEVLARRQETEEAAKTEKADKAAEEAATRDALDILVQDPGAPIPDELLARGKKAIPDFEVKVKGWREDLNKGFTDNDSLKHVYQEVLDGGGVKAVTKAMENGVFGRVEDLNAAMSFARSFEDNRSKIEDALGSASSKDFLSAIDQRTKGMTDYGTPILGMSNEGFEASFDFNRMVQEWVVRNPDASLQEREEAINKIGKTILDRMSSNAEDPMSAATYDRPEGQDFENPFTSGQLKEPEGQEPVEELPQLDVEPEATEPETNKFLEQMTPDQRKVFEKKASDLGLTPEELGKQLLNQEPSLKPIAYNPDDDDLGEGDARENGFSVEQATQFIDQAFSESSAPTSEGQAGNLKALILRHEANGNYNAVYGNAASTRDLSQFTLDEILGQQQYARRKGAASTAIGGYQFIYKTLRGLKGSMGLTGNEKFTPKLQDRMADVLLEQRGLSRFRAGQMSKRAFALNLSQEWASLPNPNTGRSYYAGDGLNASSVRPSRVYAALGMIAAEPASIGSPEAGARAYAKIPDVDASGTAGQRAKFMEWNSDPVGNHEANLQSVDPTLANVVRRAQQLAGVQFVVGSGKRDDALQKKAVEWGWSKTDESDHEHGSAVDLWGIDGDGAVTFDKATQKEIVKAMKRAAKELGVELDVGADWKGFKDNPHFSIKTTKA